MKDENKTKKERCVCPYCDEELIAAYAEFCQTCGVVFRHCLRCEITILDRETTHCPNCGEPLS